MTSHLSPRALRIAQLVAGALFLCSLAGWIVVPGLYLPEQPLEPYVTVVTGRDPQRAAELLSEAGALDVVTPDSTQVHLSRFRAVETVSLSEALRTLDPLDPRRDPWIEGLASYFSVGERNAVYARFDAPLARSDRIVRRALGSESRIAEWSLARSVWALLIYCGAAVAVVVGYGRGRTRIVPAMLVWAPLVVAFGLPAATVSSACGLILAWSTQEFDRVWTARRHYETVRLAPLRLRVGTLLATLVVSGVYLVRLSGWRAGPALAVAALGAVSAAVASTLVARERVDHGHRPFVPVVIIGSFLGSDASRRWIRAVLIALPLLVLAPPLTDNLVPGGAVPRPVPTASRRPDLDHGGLERVWAERGVRNSGDGTRLPDLADYLAHRAFQEALPYGRAYGFPGRDEAVELIRFREQPDGSYSSFTEPVLIYDSEWVEQSLRNAPRGVATMLAGLGYATGLVLSPDDAIYSGYSVFLQHLAYVVLVLAPFLLPAVPWARPRRSRGAAVDLIRRRRQVA